MSEQQETLTIQQALDRAAQYYGAGRLPEAENIYQHILRADPNQHDALAMLGSIASRVGKHDIAVDLISKAIAINPNRAETHNNLGLAHGKLGNVHDGIAEFRKALAIKPDLFDAHVNLGVALSSIGKFDDAVVSYQKALAIRPDHIVALMNLGDAQRGLGKLEEAIETYQAVIDVDPNNANAHNEMGNALRSLERLEEAVTSYRKALAANPDFATARRNEGSTLQELGRLDEAISSLEKGNTTLSRVSLLECLYSRVDKERFYKELGRIIPEDGTDIGVAAISAFASNQFDCADPYPFCGDPLNFIAVKNLKSAATVDDGFLDAVRQQIFELELSGGNQSLLKFGFQSAPTLFVDPRGPLAELRAILKDEIAAYYSNHAASDCLYIKKWPQNYGMTGWYVLMGQGGHLTMHNHPSGWLSGVVYLDVPAGKGNEANIEFGLQGNNLPILRPDYPRKTYRVTAGDLVMFPSSLFHQTVPFHSKQNRLCIAFDVNPG